MNIVDRVKNLCVSPTTEWPVIATEPTPPATLITGYVIPLAGLSAIAGFIGGSLVGQSVPFVGTFRVPLITGLGIAVYTVVMAAVAVFVLSLVINALAPTFGAEKNPNQAFKVAAYSFTPAWVAGVLQILPMLGILVLLGSLYGIYLLYLGLPRLMKCPADKAVGYTALVVVCAVVITILTAAVAGVIGGVGAYSAGMLGSTSSGSADEVVLDKDSPLGKLQELGRGLEESAKKMEAAEQSGDQGKQVAAAMEGLGALLGGGKRVDPLDIERLKPFVPETFAGLPKRSSNAEKTGFGLMVTKAEATYGNGAEMQVTLEVVDTGGVGGLMGLAAWVGVEGEREDDDGVERTRRVDGRLVHEKIARRGGTNEFSLVLGDRFLVSATSHGLDVDPLKTAVSSLDLRTLESMKDVGVSK